MPQVITTNLASLNAQRNLNASQSSLSTALQRLSSGLRINSARDDAAGLSISQRLTSQINGLNQAVRNANDGISLSQTAEGALQESGNILQRIRQLAIQSANDSNSAADRKALQAEVSQLTSELNRIANTTTFNGKKVLDGSFAGQKFQVGADANQTIDVTISDARATALGNYGYNSTNDVATFGIEVATAAGAGLGANNFKAQAVTINGSLGQSTIANTTLVAGSTARSIAAEVNNVTGSTGVTAAARTTATLGGLSAAGNFTFNLYGQNTTAVQISATVTSTTDLTAIRDAINAQTGLTGITAEGTGASLSLVQAEGYNIGLADVLGTGTATLTLAGGEGAAATLGALTTTDSSTVGGQVTFNSENAFTVSSSLAGAAGGLFGSAAAANAGTTGALSAVGSVSIASQTGANSAISVLDAALQKLSSIRADLGAVQNRFGSTIANLETTSENLEAARSRVRDADFAAETAALTRGQILQQAGTAILAQANALPNGVLALLRG
ncbi:MAG: flagellin [Betaproteobacteria bacterium]|nr:flagellin [Betaproteobacteria bacterium]